MTHRIELRIHDGAWNIEAQFVCDAGDNAPCHRYCTRPDCEEGCVCDSYDREPVMADMGECLLVLWLNDDDDDWVEQYAGPATDVRSGPIDINWLDGERYTWSYQEPQTRCDEQANSPQTAAEKLHND